MATNSNDALPEVHEIERKDGDVTFRYLSVDGVGIFPFPGLMRDGPANRFQAIRNLKTDKHDIILATFMRSGT